MARTGVLSDAHIRQHSAELFPLDAYTHENLYGQPHLEKHGMHTKKKRGRARRIYRPRAPYMLHHELAKQLNPMNAKVPHEAFGNHLEDAIFSGPSDSFEAVVARYNANFPGYTTENGMRPETAYFISEMRIDPERIFGERTRFGTFPNTRRMGLPLNDLYERLHNYERGRGDPEFVRKMDEVYSRTLDQLMTPQQRMREQQQGFLPGNYQFQLGDFPEAAMSYYLMESPRRDAYLED